MGFVFTPFTRALGDGDIDLQTLIAANDFECLLVMESSTVQDEEDSEFVGDISTLDEFDGGSYSRQVLTNVAWAQDDVENESRLTCDPIDFGNQSNGTRPILGAIVFIQVTNDADSILIAYYPATESFNPGGNPVRVSPSSNGIFRMRAINSG